MKSKRKNKTSSRILHPRILKKGTGFVTSLIAATGVPEDYASVVAWFSERLILAGVCIAAAAFAAGVLFTLYGAQPIAESQTYAVLVNTADKAKQQIIDLTSPLVSILIKDNHGKDLKKKQVAKLKAELKKYLAQKKSPFASDD